MNRSLPPCVLTIALLLAISTGSRAQKVLPSTDPPASIARLARHTADFRKSKLNGKLGLEYQPATNAWKMIHACVRRDPGPIKAMKASFGRQFKDADRDAWKAYALAIQSYHLRHVGEFPEHLQDELLVYRETWDRDFFTGLNPQKPFSRGTLRLPTAAAALGLAQDRPTAANEFVSKALDHLREAPPADLVHLNATLQSALLTGRIVEFKNDAWRKAFDDLRDRIAPNGTAPPRSRKSLAEDTIFTDSGAALRVGHVLFNDPSYLYAANKYLAAAMKNEARPGEILSPVQWASLSYEKMDRTKLETPPSLSVVHDRSFILRTGHHPRAAAVMVTDGGNTPLQFWAGGSRLTPVKTQSQDDPPPPTFDPSLSKVENRKGDAAGTLVYPDFLPDGSKLTQRFALTLEGILLIAGRYDGDAEIDGKDHSLAWKLDEEETARGENWIAIGASEHTLPYGYEGSPRAALVWSRPQPDRHEFLTVVVPFKAGLNPKSIAAAIKSADPTSVTIGKVTITLTEDSWSVTGNGR